MLEILLLLLFLAVPLIFWLYGRRWLGSQTHTAALFILAWISASILLNFAAPKAGPMGALSFVWVAINFAVFALMAKFRKKRLANKD